MLAAYTQANGSEQGFEREWPALRAEIVRQRTIAAVGQIPQSTDLATAFLSEQERQHRQQRNPLLH